MYKIYYALTVWDQFTRGRHKRVAQVHGTTIKKNMKKKQDREQIPSSNIGKLFNDSAILREGDTLTLALSGQQQKYY